MLRKAFGATMKILRDHDFQELLVDYPGAAAASSSPRNVTDQVSSDWLISGANGKEYKPDDYLKAFADFVRGEGRRRSTPYRSCWPGPSDWSAETLVELRDALSAAPEHFTETNLQRAYQATTTRRWSTSSRWSSMPRWKRAAADRRGAGRRCRAAPERRPRTDGRADRLAGLHPASTWCRTSPSTATTSTLVPVLSDRGGWGPRQPRLRRPARRAARQT